MGKYVVDVTASQLYYQTLEVEAESPKDAMNKAMAAAQDSPFFWWKSIDDGFEVTDAEVLEGEGL